MNKRGSLESVVYFALARVCNENPSRKTLCQPPYLQMLSHDLCFR